MGDPQKERGLRSYEIGTYDPGTYDPPPIKNTALNPMVGGGFVFQEFIITEPSAFTTPSVQYTGMVSVPLKISFHC